MERGKWTDKVQKEDFDRMAVRGLMAVGVFLEDEAIERCIRLTGRLNGSLTFAVKGYQTNMRSPYNVPEDKISRPTDKYTLHVGTNVVYGPSVEYGSSARGARQSLKTRRAAKATKGRKAQPYLRPALDDNRTRARNLFQDEIKAVLRGQ